MSRDHHRELVSVVIPTVLREELHGAIFSARSQNVATEVIVVVDRARDRCSSVVLSRIRQTADQVLFTDRTRPGAAAARNLGVSAARGAWVAFLDDDDEWLDGKLETQLAAAERVPERHVIVASRVLQRWKGTGKLSRPIPKRLYEGGSVAEYLFRKRSPTPRRPSIFLPTLLVDAALARAVEWDEGLARHHDWDWLVRATARPCVRLIQIPDVLALVSVGSPGSLSARPDWRPSLNWIEGVRGLVGDRVFADFVAGQVLRYALQARSATGFLSVVRALRQSRPPSVRAILLGLTGIAPRRGAEAIMHALEALAVRSGRGGAQ